MPLYSYTCDRCGTFEEWQSMSRSADPAGCPQCGGVSPRAISAPFLATMPRNARIAHERNEKAAHEPKVMTREQLQRSGRRRSEVLGHGHHGHHHHHHGKHRVHRSNRPWMIGH